MQNSCVEEKITQGDLGHPKVLEWLWDVVASLVFVDGWPNVWWIPIKQTVDMVLVNLRMDRFLVEKCKTKKEV